MGDEDRLPADVRAVTDRMSDADWHSLTVQLGRYAVQRSRRFYWRTGRSGELPYGEVAESIVSKAFLLWLTGRRRWNRGEYASLLDFLKGVIDSLLSHAANGYDNRGVESGAEPRPIADATPESALLEQERAAFADQTLAYIIQQAQQDAVVTDIISAMRDGAATRREIVRITGQPVEIIDNGLKRLRRLGAQVAQKRAGVRP